MDFMKWLNSLDGLLYEVMSWLLFFPLTFWRATVRPLEVMAEVNREAALPHQQQYSAILSPPLFLALALLFGHGVATALGQTDQIVANPHGLAGLVTDDASALILRVIVFAAFPLFLAARLVRQKGAKLDRGSLRQPFYEQCYPAAVFALGISIGTSLVLNELPRIHSAGHWLVAGSIGHFATVETLWFAKVLGRGHLRAAGNVIVGLLEGALFLIAIGFLFTR